MVPERTAMNTTGSTMKNTSSALLENRTLRSFQRTVTNALMGSSFQPG